MYVIPPIAWKWCSPEHSLHVADALQGLKLYKEITTTTINMNHDRCNDKLQTWNLPSVMTNNASMKSTLHPGVGKQRTRQNELTLLYRCPASAEAVILSMFCAPGKYKIVTEFKCSPGEQNTSHFTYLFCLGFHGGFWGCLSSIGLLSPPRMVSLGSFLEQVLCRQVTVHTDPSWMVSFADWCLSFLHGMASHSTCRSSQDQTTNYVPQSWMSHSVFFWAESFLPIQ